MRCASPHTDRRRRNRPAACKPAFPSANNGSDVFAGRAGRHRRLTNCLVGLVDIGGLFQPAPANCHVMRRRMMHGVTCRDLPRR